MNITVYLPYYEYNDNDFEVDKDYYKSNDEYFNAIRENIQSTRNAVIQGMNNYMNNGSVKAYKDEYGQTYRYANKERENEDKVVYSKCEALIYDSNGKEETVDNFISDYVSKEMQLYVFKFNLDTADEEFEQEVNLWNTEHNKLQKYNERDEDWVFENEPIRNIKIKFTNNVNEEKYAELVNCKLMEKQSLNIYVVLVEEIKLIDKI